MNSLFNLKNTSKTHAGSLFLFVIFLLFNSNLRAQSKTETKDAGILSFEKEEIDYGTIQQNANGERTFVFTNTGTAPIVITSVKTSCGCTVPTYSKTPVLPGKKGEIKVKYATNRIGPFTKTITVISNASVPTKMLRIKGTVLKPETKVE